MAYTNLTSNLLLTWPIDSAQPGILKVAGSAWDNSPWQLILPKTDVGIRLTGISVNLPSVSAHGVEFDLGFGPAGAETIFAQFSCYMHNAGARMVVFPFIVPRDIDPFTEIYGRWRTSSTIQLSATIAPLYEVRAAATKFCRRYRGNRRWPV